MYGGRKCKEESSLVGLKMLTSPIPIVDYA
jgi:hypothetical protein